MGLIKDLQNILILVEGILDLGLHILNDNHRELHIHGKNHIVLRRFFHPLETLAL